MAEGQIRVRRSHLEHEDEQANKGHVHRREGNVRALVELVDVATRRPGELERPRHQRRVGDR